MRSFPLAAAGMHPLLLCVRILGFTLKLVDERAERTGRRKRSSLKREEGTTGGG